MTNKFRIIALTVLASTALVRAQNIDQEVAVSNDYIVRFEDFQRQTVNATLVDSLYKFDYDFDYSVFDSPYKGAFEFTPYQVQISPSPLPFDGKNFYLRAGAGLSLYPKLDFVYVPISGKKFKLIITDKANGHYGIFEDTPKNRGDFFASKGYYLFNDFKIATITDFEKTKLKFDLNVGNRYGRTSTSFLNFNMVGANLSLASNSKSKLDYSLKALYNYCFTDGSSGLLDYGFFSVNADLIALNIGSHRVGLVFDYKQIGSSYLIALTPSYKLKGNRYSLSAGARFDYSSTSVFSIKPNIEGRFIAVKEKLNIYGNVLGGQALNSSYFVYMSKSPLYANLPLTAYCDEVIHIQGGLDGQLFKYLNYNLVAGYRILRNSPLDGLRTLIAQDFDLLYGKAYISWRSKRLNIESEFIVNRTMVEGKRTNAFAPAKLEGNIALTYNWLNRIYAGISLQGSSSRRCISGIYSDIPAYFDLGLNAEYKLSRKMSVWLNSGNLLAMPIEKIPGIIEKSPYITIGFSLTL